MSERDYMRSDFGRAPRSPFWATAAGTKGLIIGLVAIHFLLAVLRSVSPELWGELWMSLSLQPDEVLRKFYVWQLVTSALLHQGLFHIFFNCVAIWFFGRVVEQRLGMKRYLLFALAAAMSASLAYLLFAVLGSSVLPMVGASGAAMGMIALAALWHPHMPVLFFFLIQMPLWLVALVAIGIDVLGVLSVDSNIAHAAHLGGALYGWIHYRTGGGIERLLAAVDRYAEKRRRRHEQRRQQDDARLRDEIDRILDKVNREGMGALSEDERRFLKDASARFRR